MVVPDVFTDDEDGYGRPVLDGKLLTSARRAGGSYPEQAIAITGDMAVRS